MSWGYECVPTMVMIIDIVVVEHAKYFICVYLVVDNFASHYDGFIIRKTQNVWGR